MQRSHKNMNAVPAITLNDGNTIPQLGFGVYQIPPEETARAVGQALEIGYRHIDTAAMYGNEKGVGEAVRASGLDRGDVYVTSTLSNAFHEPDEARRALATPLPPLGLAPGDVYVTSKLSNAFHEPDEARRAFDTTLSELGFDYVDLFLIHWPLPTVYNGDFVPTWKALTECESDGG